MNRVYQATAHLLAQTPLRLQLLLHSGLGENGVTRQLADPPCAIADGSELDGRDTAPVAANRAGIAAVVA